MKIPKALDNRRLRRILTRLIFNGFIQAMMSVANAQLVKLAFDNLIRNTSPNFNQDAVYLGLGLIGTAIALAWLRITERIDAVKMGQSYAYSVRMTLYRKLAMMSPRALQTRSQGGVTLRFVGDLTSLRQWVSFGLARIIVAVVNTVVTLIALSLINIQIAAIATLILLLGAFIAWQRGKNLQTAAQEARYHVSKLAGDINEKVSAIAVVQIFGQSHREKKRLTSRSRALETAMVNRGALASQLRGLSEATLSLASAVALLVGAREVALGRTTPGTIIGAMTILGFLMPPLRDLGRIQEYWHNSRVSRRKIQEFLKTPNLITEIPNAIALEVTQGSLEFDHVSFGGILNQVKVRAEPGQVIALVGSNGAGKSTLLSLTARLIDPENGSIYLDGQDIANHSLASLRRNIGMASPDLPLLRGSIGRNLRYRYPRADEKEIARVWQLCEINELLAELPQGEKTKIAEGGKGLSAGQRQRISLARAILGNPKILLLDEIDANLDPKATTIVDRVLENHDGTVLIITHRPERLALADAIWSLENGKIKVRNLEVTVP
ncbi:ABC-type multidrug transport system, ATPase and permease component [Xenococcus sp. PCC 7305]|uniref:ABC transporter ATP-binding protein n=1 Tax=Xenococcus sp. PCC 7305 TaxID=102125 RepID=UPI0002ACCD47|nr:ABC transporter ATP-binding protein [Xenococcus sp. PCC 7305]ELS02470.1 ABC-type multidrug transport system, ATPase and permease component [Xenococcus sp. PCC 7305]